MRIPKDYKVSILIIDDLEMDQAAAVQEIKGYFSELSTSNISIKTASTIEDGLELLNAEDFQAVILDHELGTDFFSQTIYGTDYIQDILEIQPSTRVIVSTSHDSSELSQEVIKNGAQHFITKGTAQQKREHRKKVILSVLKQARFEIEMSRRNSIISNQVHPNEFKYLSSAMKTLDMKLERLAEVSSHVLFLGEPGSGKSHTAKKLCYLREKFLGETNRPFKYCNINETPNNLIHSHIFGHEKGAFTGADKRHIGFLEQASTGCLMLDEIGDASLELQGALLNVIQEREFQRLGSDKVLKTNARFIFATNKDLKKLIKEGKFRKDFYDRICAIQIKMPSLHERKADIPYICQNITDRLKKDQNKNISYNDFPDDLKHFLTHSKIDGNIRGMQNILIRIVSFCDPLKNGKLDYSKWKKLVEDIDVEPMAETSTQTGFRSDRCGLVN